MSKNELKPIYVAPSPKAELGGKEGLYADEIAISLGIPPKKVRSKLESEGFLGLLKEYDFDTVRFRTPNKSNSIEFTEYALETIAAKFFVARYNNKMGNGYLIYLLQLEAFVEKQKGMTSRLELFCQTDPIFGLHLSAIKERKRVLERREAQDQKHYEGIEAIVNRNLPSTSLGSLTRNLAKKSSRKTAGNSISETISLKKLSQDYFYGLAPHIINRYLKSVNHGKKGSMWLREGIEFAARRFFKDVTFDRHIEDQKLNVYYHKPIGFHFTTADHVDPLPISNN